ncbi:MAG: GMC family oxidoreductase [Haloferacaceae archaeon]|jgi:choline dehydrogenase-like flavoprotein
MNREPAGRADLLVVGAGPAGSLVARETAAAGHDVVVLDAGPRFDGDRTERMEAHLRPDEGSAWPRDPERDGYTTDGRPYPLAASRVKGVGGSTLAWHGMAPRLRERDFELAARHGVGVDWPLSYADLRPWYARAERAFGVAGAADDPDGPPREEPYPMPAFPPSASDQILAEGAEQVGIATRAAPNARNSEARGDSPACVGYGTCRPVCPSGAKYTAERTVASAEAAGARVVDRAPVRRLRHDGDRVTGALYTTPEGEHVQEARHVVLAAGGVENARLLLLSRSDAFPDGLANASGAVGRYFTDHLFAGVGGRVDRETRQHHVGFHTTESSALYDDAEPVVGIKLEFLNNAGPTPVGVALSDGSWGDELRARIDEAYGGHLAVGALVEQLPDPENRVTLDPEQTDGYGDPVPRIEWSIDDRTRAGIERANEVQRAVLEAVGAEVTWTVDAETTGPAAHQMGTTRMGTDPAESVVDPDCRAHDLSNLWVAGSSVFPTGGAMNPTLTIAALALRLGDHLDGVLAGAER